MALIKLTDRLDGLRLSTVVGFLFLYLIAALMLAVPAYAQSSGCSAINSTWSSGRTFTDGDELYQSGLTVLAGERLTYTVVTSGTTTPGQSGFAVYKNDGTGPFDVLLEAYASPGAELNFVNQTIYIPEDDNEFIVYAWSEPSGGTVQATVTCGSPSPVITSHPANRAVPVGGTATLDVTATNATGYQWQVSTGAGFGAIADGGVYSGAQTSALTISGTTLAMDGYTYRVVATGATATSATSNAATLTVFEPPVASNVSTSVSADSGYNPITLSTTGAVSSVATPSLAIHGTVNVAGTTIAYMPNSGYTGTDSFTYTASFAGVTSAPATVTINVVPTAPVAGGVSATVAADSENNPITLNLSGYPATGVAIGTQAIHGTATATGTSITYTPGAGYYGPDSFTYTATNDGGTSAPATVTVTVSQPLPELTSVTPDQGSTTGGMSVTLTGSNFETSAASNTVIFGSTTATVTAASATSLTVTAPAHAAGTVNVSVTTGGGTDTLASGFTYIAAPTVSGVSVPANGTYKVGETLAFTVHFDQIVTVTGVPSLGLTVGSSARQAGYLGGSGGSALSFGYTVQAGDLDMDGIALGALSLNGGTIRNGFGSDASLTLNSIGSTAGVLIDGVAPEVTLITVQGSPAPNATTVTFAVAFSETVYNLDASDFSLTTTGTAAGTIDSVSTPTGSATVVTIDGISGNGTLRLDLTNNLSGIIDTTGNSLAGAFTSGATHTVLQVPVAGDDTLTVAANSTGTAITLNLSGGMAASVAVGTSPAHGTATVAGTTIEYTPTGGYSGPDSFAYTASNAAGTSAPATVTITVSPAELTLLPTTLPDGVANTLYADQTLTASGGTEPYSFTLNSGSLPDGLDLTTGGTLSGTPAVHGPFSFTVKATDIYGAVGLADYGLVIAEEAVTAAPVAATVAANSTGNPITLALSGGAASSVAVTSAPSHGTATATGAAITYSPTAGYSGTDSFTYTATNSAGTSAPATVTVTVTAPTLVLSPLSLANGEVDTYYAQPFTASGGTAPYGFAITDGMLPDSLTLDADGILSGTPSVDGTFSFTVTATDNLGAIGSAAYTLAIGEQPVIANGVAATVAANSSGNPITLDLSGGTAASIAIASPASHGSATASGTSITYTPTVGYSGTDSFTYTATNGAGTSAPAIVTVTVTAPTVVLSPSSLPNGEVGTGYNQAITATAGTAPYGFSVTSGALPTGLTLAASGALTGTPTAKGNFMFTVTVTDALGATGSLAYTLEIEHEPATFAFTPVSGALPEAMAGEAYSAPITSTGGVAPVIYSIVSGALPAGMVLNVSTGGLNGTLDAGTEGSYDFAIQATDTNGDTGTASYTLVVAEREITVTNKEVSVAPGATPANVNLEDGATGGPFTSANIVSVEPANAGTAQIIMGEFAQAGGPPPVSFYLKFTPNPAYSGQVVVRFTLASSLGTSNPGIVTYNLGYDPVAVVQEMEGLARDFVQTRQSLIASTVKVPGLLERRVMAAASDPVTGRLSPSGDGLVLNFATSLAEMKAAASAAASVIDVGEPPFNLWVNGTLMVHNRAANDNRWGSFGMVSAGADYLLGEKVLVGLSFHYDHMTDPTDPDALLTGNGWLAGPYASFELGEGVFWDSSLLYGGSSNTIDTDFWDGTFDTTRWLLDTAITGQWQLDEVTVLTPRLRAVYLNEAAQSYTVENAAGDTIVLNGFTSEQLRVSLGAELARQFVFEDGSALTPKLGVTGGFSGLDGSGAFGSIATGLNWQSPGTLSIDGGLLFNIESSGQTSVGARVVISGQF